MNQVDHPVQPDELGDGLKPVEGENVNDENRHAQPQNLCVGDGPQNAVSFLESARIRRLSR